MFSIEPENSAWFCLEVKPAPPLKLEFYLVCLICAKNQNVFSFIFPNMVNYSFKCLHPSKAQTMALSEAHRVVLCLFVCMCIYLSKHMYVKSHKHFPSCLTVLSACFTSPPPPLPPPSSLPSLPKRSSGPTWPL